MARVIGIDHLSIRVSDVDASRRFYDALLSFLGFKRKYDFGEQVGWSNGKTLFWIGQADEAGKRHRHRIGDVGFHHYAFELARRQDVDDLDAHLRKMGARIVDAAADYPAYGKGYYAVFFLDPDGLKLEGMYFPPTPRRKKKAAKKKQR